MPRLVKTSLPKVAKERPLPTIHELRIQELEGELAAAEAARELDQSAALFDSIQLLRPTLALSSLLPADQELLTAAQTQLHALHQMISTRLDELEGFDRDLSEMRGFVLHGLLCWNRCVRMSPHCEDPDCIAVAARCQKQLVAWGLARVISGTGNVLAAVTDPPHDLPLTETSRKRAS